MVPATLRGEPFNSQRCVYPTALLVSFNPSKHSANIQLRNAPSYFILNQAAVPSHSTNTRTMTETTAEPFSCSVLKFWPSYIAVPLLCSLQRFEVPKRFIFTSFLSRCIENWFALAAVCSIVIYHLKEYTWRDEIRICGKNPNFQLKFQAHSINTPLTIAQNSPR